MADTFQMPGATVIERADGSKFPISLIAANRACGKIAEDCEREGLKNFEYVEKFAAWVAEATAGQVTLTPDEADALFDWVQLQHARKKKATVDELRQSSQSSTEPTPSVSDQGNS